MAIFRSAGVRNMKFWIWWFPLGLLLTGIGYFLFSSFIHAGGLGLWIGNLLLPGLWLSSLAKPILPSAILDSNGYLWLFIFVTQMLLWYVLGLIVLRFIPRANTPDAN